MFARGLASTSRALRSGLLDALARRAAAGVGTGSGRRPLSSEASSLAEQSVRVCPEKSLKEKPEQEESSENEEDVLEAMSPSSFLHVRSFAIGTLDPAKLTEEDYLDLSGTGLVTISARNHPDIRAPLILAGLGKQKRWCGGEGGFLYLYKPPGAPEVAATIRLRITNNPDPRSFEAGTDWTWRSLPWHFPLMYRPSPVLRELLFDGGLLSARGAWDLVQCSRRKAHGDEGVPCTMNQMPLLYSLAQPFEIKFGVHWNDLWTLYVVGGRLFARQVRIPTPNLPIKPAAHKTHEGAATERSEHPKNVGKGLGPLIYKRGAAIVRFEGPERMLRVLKIVKPIKAAHIPDFDVPEITEGSIIPFINRRTKSLVPMGVLKLREIHNDQKVALRNLPDLPPEPNVAHLLSRAGTSE